MTSRQAQLERSTRETSLAVNLTIDGRGNAEIDTGVGFLDHLLQSLAFHARWDITLSCKGDLQVDDHHTAEDCAIAIGMAIDRALSERKGISRFGSAYAPLDEALARAVVDVSGRPFADIDLGLQRDALGDLSCENVPHVLSSLATAARIALHVDVLKGTNDHHRAEAAFKATALALRCAMSPSTFEDIPSIKGTLGEKP